MKAPTEDETAQLRLGVMTEDGFQEEDTYEQGWEEFVKF